MENDLNSGDRRDKQRVKNRSTKNNQDSDEDDYEAVKSKPAGKAKKPRAPARVKKSNDQDSISVKNDLVTSAPPPTILAEYGDAGAAPIKTVRQPSKKAPVAAAKVAEVDAESSSDSEPFSFSQLIAQKRAKKRSQELDNDESAATQRKKMKSVMAMKDNKKAEGEMEEENDYEFVSATIESQKESEGLSAVKAVPSRRKTPVTYVDVSDNESNVEAVESESDDYDSSSDT